MSASRRVRAQKTSDVIVIVGFMGAGKTVVGRALANKLGIPFVDLDEEIERTANASIREIFESQGEATFRDLERSTLSRALSESNGVVSVGGGAVEDESNRAALQEATVVFLDATLEVALARIGEDAGRPMLTRSDPARLYEHRRGLYERVADVSVDTSSRAIDEVVDEVVAAIGAGRSA